jgi:hypothetical protein
VTAKRVDAYQRAAKRCGTVFEPTTFAGKRNPLHLFGAVTKHRLDPVVAKRLCDDLRKLGAPVWCAQFDSHDEDSQPLVILAASAFTEGDTL